MILGSDFCSDNMGTKNQNSKENPGMDSSL